MHMKRLNGASGGANPLCFIDLCEYYDTEPCSIWDTCKTDYSPPCSFIDRCNID